MTENKYHIHVGIFDSLGIQLTTEKQKARLGTLACLRVHAPGARLGSTPNSSSRTVSAFRAFKATFIAWRILLMNSHFMSTFMYLS